jgi:flavin reductase (DIM6/NTAB) family NADH-FMN oxidoreductase RutF
LKNIFAQYCLPMHQVKEPAILYFGTPVVLISTKNEHGTYNLAPMSSVFWLGWRCIIGLSAFSKTTENIIREKQCVLNLPSVNQVAAVNKLALTTGSNPVPEGKQQKGYRFEPNKFEHSGLTPVRSLIVNAPRVLECPVQLEAELKKINTIADDNLKQKGRLISFELRIVKVHIEESILMDGFEHRIDPDKWKPLIMSFQQFYTLGSKVEKSVLGTIPEHTYNTPDLEYARTL